MEHGRYLGIYLKNNSAQVVLITHKGHTYSVLDSFVVSLLDNEQNEKTIGQLIAEGISAKNFDYEYVAATIDSSEFTQYNIRSEFIDTKQIEQTYRFDAEEQMATDAFEQVMSYTVTDQNESGSKVTVFSALKNRLSSILKDLQSNGIDPVMIEPDAICLSRAISSKTECSDKAIYTIISDEEFYVSVISEARKYVYVRSFMLDGQNNKSKLIGKNISLTLSAMPVEWNVESVYYQSCFDPEEFSYLESKFSGGLKAVEGVSKPDEVSLTIAAGAAMSGFDRSFKADFRREFSPFKGATEAIRKTLRIASICVTIVLLALSFYVYNQMGQVKGKTSQLNERILADYPTVMRGANIPSNRTPAEALKREIIRVKRAGKNELGSDVGSVPSMLTLLFKSLNQVASSVDYQFDSIDIKRNSIVLNGSTGSSSETLKLYQTIKSNPRLVTGQFSQSRNSKTGRDTFKLTATLSDSSNGGD